MYSAICSSEVNQTPLVSILIPAYNPTYFSEALDSALNQSYSNTEIIVSDDSGGRHIRRMVSKLSDEKEIRYRINKRNIGARRNYLKCFNLSKGYYIKFLNDDDILHHECVQRMVNVLEHFTDVSLVCSRRRLIDGKGNTLPDTPFTRPVVDTDSIIPGSLAIRKMLERQLNFIGEPTTALFRRKDIEWVSPDIMSFGGRHVMANLDVAMWLNLLSRGNLVYLTEALSCFRMHGEQEQQKDDVRALCIAAWRQVIADALKLGLLAPNADSAEKITPLNMQPTLLGGGSQVGKF